jgi:hypothetical protein
MVSVNVADRVEFVIWHYGIPETSPRLSLAAVYERGLRKSCRLVILLSRHRGSGRGILRVAVFFRSNRRALSLGTGPK